jgi:hypothetical protein
MAAYFKAIAVKLSTSIAPSGCCTSRRPLTPFCVKAHRPVSNRYGGVPLYFLSLLFVVCCLLCRMCKRTRACECGCWCAVCAQALHEMLTGHMSLTHPPLSKRCAQCCPVDIARVPAVTDEEEQCTCYRGPVTITALPEVLNVVLVPLVSRSDRSVGYDLVSLRTPSPACPGPAMREGFVPMSCMRAGGFGRRVHTMRPQL